MDTNDTAAAKKPSALAALKALAEKKPAPAGSPGAAFQIDDPAIAGAKLRKNTVVLGMDPCFLAQAQYAANLHAALERAEAEFAVAQAAMRDYGISKRHAYNDAFRANVTTVEVPYYDFLQELPKASAADRVRHAPAPGQEAKVIQVICSNKYSVAQDTTLQNRDRLGEDFSRLFKLEETRTLKPNAQDLLLGVFAELGLEGEQLDTIMGQLFETKVKVSTTETYEQEVKRLPDDLKGLLSQMVTRAQPGLKFPST